MRCRVNQKGNTQLAVLLNVSSGRRIVGGLNTWDFPASKWRWAIVDNRALYIYGYDYDNGLLLIYIISFRRILVFMVEMLLREW